jgi:hypothetical protein
VVIKVMKGIDGEALRQLAEHEEEVLGAVTGKPYMPQFYGSFRTEQVEEESGVVRPCANLITGWVLFVMSHHTQPILTLTTVSALDMQMLMCQHVFVWQTDMACWMPLQRHFH